jgi:hypothetical protein
MDTILNHFRIFNALLSRDIKWMLHNLSTTIIDCLAPLATQIISFGYMLPLFGMATSMIGAVYLGSILNLFVQLGYALVLKIAFDLNANRFIDYHLTLPIPKKWLFASYIISHMIETALVTIPLILGGILCLQQYIPFAAINWFGFACIFIAMLAFLSTFFLMLGYSFTLPWILDNIWPRILVPMWLFSAGLVPFKKISMWWPNLGYVMLISPITYIAEGLRSALLGTDQYLAWEYCLIPLMIWTILNLALLTNRIYKRLDPV